jgi:hypothetical protein
VILVPAECVLKRAVLVNMMVKSLEWRMDGDRVKEGSRLDVTGEVVLATKHIGS